MHTQSSSIPEEWRSVVGYEGFYSVSSLGRIRRDLPGKGSRAGHIRKPNVSKRGYHLTTLCRNGIVFSATVHSLVAAAFIGPRPEGFTINHKDGCKANNAYSNLEYVTDQGNKDHAKLYGLLASGDRSPRRRHPESYPIGEDIKRVILTEQQVRYIRDTAAPGTKRQHELAAMYSVSYETVCDVISYRTWKHVV